MLRHLTRLALTGLAFSSAPALAGGIGVVGTAGFHQVNAPYYRSDGEQGIDSQIRPNFGYGAELMLGDKDDRIQGLARLFAVSDAPPNEPDTSGESSDYEYVFPAHHEQGNETSGVLLVGVQWGILGDPAGLQLVANTVGGAAFATRNNTEFVMVEGAVGGTYAINDRLQAFANVGVAGRYRKRLSVTENVYVGARFLLD